MKRVVITAICEKRSTSPSAHNLKNNACRQQWRPKAHTGHSIQLTVKELIFMSFNETVFTNTHWNIRHDNDQLRRRLWEWFSSSNTEVDPLGQRISTHAQMKEVRRVEVVFGKWMTTGVLVMRNGDKGLSFQMANSMISISSRPRRLWLETWQLNF